MLHLEMHATDFLWISAYLNKKNLCNNLGGTYILVAYTNIADRKQIHPAVK